MIERFEGKEVSLTTEDAVVETTVVEQQAVVEEFVMLKEELAVAESTIIDL